MNQLYIAGLTVLEPSIGLIFWTTVIFLITWSILGKFAFKPIAQAIKKREETIEVALQSAVEAERKMAELTAQNEAIIKAAREEKAAILNDAKNAAEKIIGEARNQAKIETDKMVSNAKLEIDSQKNSALAEVKKEAGTIAINIAEKLIKAELKGNKQHEDLVASLIKETSLN